MHEGLSAPGPAAVAQLLREIAESVGPSAILDDPADLLAYDSDAFPAIRCRPKAVILPESTEQVAAAVRLCVRHGVPFVPRGAGTGLSGGATPIDGSVVLSLSRLDRILSIDAANRRATVQAGCTNLRVSEAVRHLNLHYAPDPSSQGVCTIGGNVAENAGGPHTLRYGVTVNHVCGLRVVLPSGEIEEYGGVEDDPAGYDLVGLFVGSEGTFGIVTEATLRLTPLPQAVRTLLAVFDTVEACTHAVIRTIATGVVPCALEMIDRTILNAIEDAFGLGFPRDAAAVLTIEVDGAEAGIDEDAAAVRAACIECGAREVRVASEPADRAALWLARRKGVGTAGRLAPNIITQDGAIPRSKLPEVLAATADAARRHGIRVCNIFHAGDGNLHPCVLYDTSDADEAARVHAFNTDVLRLCVEAGGTITGEHGVGLEKRTAMELMFGPADLDCMRAVKRAFDPDGICNPGKVIPCRP